MIATQILAIVLSHYIFSSLAISPFLPIPLSLAFFTQCLLQPLFVLCPLNNISWMFDGCLQYAACSLPELVSNYTSLFLISPIDLLFPIKK